MLVIRAAGWPSAAEGVMPLPQKDIMNCDDDETTHDIVPTARACPRCDHVMRQTRPWPSLARDVLADRDATRNTAILLIIVLVPLTMAVIAAAIVLTNSILAGVLSGSVVATGLGWWSRRRMPRNR
jgi:hypothetical protein